MFLSFETQLIFLCMYILPINLSVFLRHDRLKFGETVQESQSGHPQVLGGLRAQRVLLLANLQVLECQAGIIPSITRVDFERLLGLIHLFIIVTISL